MEDRRFTPKNPFHRARQDRSQETFEDYVELIADLIHETGEARAVDLANRLGVTSVTVTKTLQRLEKAGLITTEPYRSIFLTEEGRKLAQEAKVRHGIVLDFLRAIGVPPETAEQDSEGMEHHISEETLGCMRRFLENKDRT